MASFGRTIRIVLAALVATTAVASGQEAMHKAHDRHAGSAPATNAAIEAEAGFLRENDIAMERMMRAMAVTPSGDVDRDFVAMMIPHHQGAIDMAKALLRYGRNEQLRRLAQEIIVTQQQEITAMRLAIGDPLPVATAAQAAPAAE